MYYTQYKLKFTQHISEDTLIHIVCDLRGTYETAMWAIDEYGDFNESVQWDSIISDMIEFSQKWRGITFEFICHTEDYFDYKLIFNNGFHHFDYLNEEFIIESE